MCQGCRSLTTTVTDRINIRVNFWKFDLSSMSTMKYLALDLTMFWHTQMSKTPCIKCFPSEKSSSHEFLWMSVSFYAENIFCHEKTEIIPFPKHIGSRIKSIGVGEGRLGNVSVTYVTLDPWRSEQRRHIRNWDVPYQLVTSSHVWWLTNWDPYQSATGAAL